MSAPRPNFDWTRFWVPRDGHLIPDDEDFLADPEGRHGSFRNPSALRFESVSSRRCTVLLGEPGIGKTTELERVNRQGASFPAGTEVLELNLNNYSSDGSLIQDLFDNPKFREWASGSHELLLSLDSLDECMLRVETVANLLSSRLGRYPVERLWLRIACRTAIWTQLQFLEDALQRLWREEFGAFELLPLRRKDVESAAAASGVEPEAFLREVISRKAVPFAIKPLTLLFLLRRFRRDRRLPDQIGDIYLEGCRWLCTELNPSRRATGKAGKLSPDQRLAVAGRLAALTLFAGRTAILQGDELVDVIDGDLTIQDTLGGCEEENGQVVEITPEAIRETLDTGLFSARGASRLGWAHQTYGEFLAARYVVIRHGFDTTQKISLVTHPGYSSRLVIPQLVQTTVCMVNMDPSLFDELVQDSPHVLLRSEANAWDARQKSVLTASFLKLIAELKLTDSDVEVQRNFSKLNYPDLASQLEPYIRDRTANPVVRRVVIGIAEDCRVAELREPLLEVALDESDHQPTRVKAIRALRELGDLAARQRLAELLDSDLTEDVDDQIRGAVLKQVWPELLSFDAMAKHLTEPKEPFFIGAYCTFLEFELATGLQPGDIPKALAWVAAQEGRHSDLSPLSKAADGILKHAYEQIDDPAVLAPLVEAVTFRLENGRNLWHEDRFDESPDLLQQDDRKRHTLVRAFVERASDVKTLSQLRIIRRFREDDLSWLLQQSSTAPTEAEQSKWSLLVQELFLTDVDRYWNQILKAASQNKTLAEDIRFWIGPIALDSPMADWQRKEWHRSQKATLEEEETVAQTSSLQQVDLVLQETGAESKNAWQRLADLLADRQQHQLNADLRKYRPWQQLDKERRSRVVRAAQDHILRGEDPVSSTMNRSFSASELASFRALYLTSAEAPDFYRGLDQDLIEKWTPLILKRPGLVEREAEPYRNLLRLGWQKAPKLVAQKISQAIDQQNRAAGDDEHPLLAIQLQECWDERIELLLSDKLKNHELKPGFAAYLMEVLLEKGSEQARQWALQLLGGPIPSEPREQEMQFRVALSLLLIERDFWNTIWNRITALASLQDALAEQAANHLYNEFEQGRLVTLEGSQLGQICDWLQRVLAQNARPKDGFLADWRATAEVFRGQLFNYLQKAGTPQALQALQYLVQLHPEAQWMLAEAQQAQLRHTWIPPEPATILAMARRPDTRFVDSGEQLLAVVVESLNRLEQKLHGHSPRIDSLWNKRTDDKGVIHWQPVDEESLSNSVKFHLEDDLQGRAIILNREVEIRRSLGKKIRQGQETDIQVDAIARSPRSGEPHRITVIIEIKGCWNQGLKAEMKEQLADRYLAESDCRHGLYLIGWFLCDAWDREDYRRAQTPKWSLQQAREHFQAQAAELSQGQILIRSFVLDTALR